MNYQQEREEFLVTMACEGLPVSVGRLVLRHANTIQRLSAAECNGDWPCDNGQRPVCFCDNCEAGYVRSAMVSRAPDKVICKNCATQQRIALILAPFNIKPNFQVDPRGSCVKLAVPSGKTDDMGRSGLCVPTHRY